MKDLSKFLLPFFLILFFTFVFFWKVFIFKEVPVPGDFTVGTYYPWLDYKWGFEVGVPVKNPITSDVVSIIYPMQSLAIDMWKSGQIPLWNPYIFAGTPLLANFQSAVFSPTNFVYAFMNRFDGWTAQIILQHLLAAGFTYLLLRRWKVSVLGSLLGGLIYAFSGFNVIWSEWNGHALAAAFIPLGIFLADRLLVDGGIGSGVLIAPVVAMLLFSGYPQVALYFLIALGILSLLYIRWNRTMLFRTFLMGLFILIGVGLSAPQTLPGAELLKYSQRTVETISFDYEFLHWEKAITFLAPDFFGNHSTGNYWGSQNYTSNEGFVGVVAFSLSVFVWHLYKKNKQIKYSIILLILSLVLAFPTPVSILLWKSGIFGLNAAFAHRSLVLFNLSVAILAGFGIDNFIKEKKVALRSLVLSGLLLFGFLSYAGAMFYFSRSQPEKFSPLVLGVPAYSIALRNLIFPITVYVVLIVCYFLANRLGMKGRKMIAILLFLLTFTELCRFGWKYLPFSSKNLVFPETPVIKFLESRQKPVRVTSLDSFSVDMRMPYKIESLEGYDATYPATIARIIAAVNSGRSDTSLTGQHGLVETVSSPLLQLLNTRYFLQVENKKVPQPSPPQKSAPQKLVKVFTDRSSVVFEDAASFPRAFMVYDWERVNGGNNYLNLLLAKDFPYKSKVLVEDYTEVPGKAGIYKVEYKKYLETESIINVETSEDGLLFISDTFFPGWKAFVDGKETPIYKADFAFRAIPVGKGLHEVKMVYRPQSFVNGLKIFGFSLIFLLVLYPALTIIGRRKARE